jgi:hypothetical protein
MCAGAMMKRCSRMRRERQVSHQATLAPAALGPEAALTPLERLQLQDRWQRRWPPWRPAAVRILLRRARRSRWLATGGSHPQACHCQCWTQACQDRRHLQRLMMLNPWRQAGPRHDALLQGTHYYRVLMRAMCGRRLQRAWRVLSSQQSRHVACHLHMAIRYDVTKSPYNASTCRTLPPLPRLLARVMCRHYQLRIHGITAPCGRPPLQPRQHPREAWPCFPK